MKSKEDIKQAIKDDLRKKTTQFNVALIAPQEADKDLALATLAVTEALDKYAGVCSETEWEIAISDIENVCEILNACALNKLTVLTDKIYSADTIDMEDILLEVISSSYTRVFKQYIDSGRKVIFDKKFEDVEYTSKSVVMEVIRQGRVEMFSLIRDSHGDTIYLSNTPSEKNALQGSALNNAFQSVSTTIFDTVVKDHLRLMNQSPEAERNDEVMRMMSDMISGIKNRNALMEYKVPSLLREMKGKDEYYYALGLALNTAANTENNPRVRDEIARHLSDERVSLPLLGVSKLIGDTLTEVTINSELGEMFASEPEYLIALGEAGHLSGEWLSVATDEKINADHAGGDKPRKGLLL